MDLRKPLLWAVTESVIRELDDNALLTLERAGIKGAPQEPCACPVAKYVKARLEEMYDTARTGITVSVNVYSGSIDVMLYRPDGSYWDSVTVDDPGDMGAFSFAAKFDAQASWHPFANRYHALIG